MSWHEPSAISSTRRTYLSVVARQGRLEEAETLYARALDLLRGEDAQLTVFTLCNVAYLYSSNGHQTAPLKFMQTSPLAIGRSWPSGVSRCLNFVNWARVNLARRRVRPH